MNRVGEVDPAGESEVTWESSPRGDRLALDMDGLLVSESFCTVSAQCLESTCGFQGAEPPFFGSFFDSTHRTHFSYHLPAMANGTNFIRRLVPDCRITSHLVCVFY